MPRPMVGPPKSLMDLRRIEAAVRITCDACGHVVVRDREDMINELLAQQRTLDWRLLQGVLRCEECTKGPVRLLALPFTTVPGRATASPAEMIRVNLALKVLSEANTRSTKEPVGTTEVRLALRVLAPYVRDQGVLTEYWRAATEEPRQVWSSCHQPYRWIVKRIVDRGYPVWAELRP